MIGYAIDLSNHSGRITPAWAREAWDMGFRRAILSTYDPAVFANQYDALLTQGFELDAYCYLNFPGGEFYSGLSAEEQMAVAIRHMNGRVVGMMWVDCEDEAAFHRSAIENTDFIADAAAACRYHVFSGIYTRRDWWLRATKDSRLFETYLLWDCTNDDTPDLARADYGGWGVPYMEQYSFYGTIAGLPVDLNVYGDIEPVIGVPVTDHEEMQAAVEGADMPKVKRALDIAQGVLALAVAEQQIGTGLSSVSEIESPNAGTTAIMVVIPTERWIAAGGN